MDTYIGLGKCYAYATVLIYYMYATRDTEIATIRFLGNRDDFLCQLATIRCMENITTNIASDYWEIF